MKNKPFALRVQTALITVLLACFVLMGQSVSQTVFQIGTVLLIVAALLQIDFGNINPEYDAKQTMSAFLKIMAVIVIVFAAGIYLAPMFLNKTFVKNFVQLIIYGTTALFVFFILLGTRDKQQKKGGGRN